MSRSLLNPFKRNRNLAPRRCMMAALRWMQKDTGPHLLRSKRRRFPSLTLNALTCLTICRPRPLNKQQQCGSVHHHTDMDKPSCTFEALSTFTSHSSEYYALHLVCLRQVRVLFVTLGWRQAFDGPDSTAMNVFRSTAPTASTATPEQTCSVSLARRLAILHGEMDDLDDQYPYIVFTIYVPIRQSVRRDRRNPSRSVFGSTPGSTVRYLSSSPSFGSTPGSTGMRSQKTTFGKPYGGFVWQSVSETTERKHRRGKCMS